MDLPFRVTICGIDELEDHCNAQVSHVISILDPGWPVPEVFDVYGAHVKLELRFDDIIRPSPVAPAERDVVRLLEFGRTLDGEVDAHLLVHCHAGVSRSSASLALLLAQAMPEISAIEIFAEILRIRPQIWPNLRILRIGDALLGRNGELVAAVRGIYRRQLDADPGMAEEFRGYGRNEEVEFGLANED